MRMATSLTSSTKSISTFQVDVHSTLTSFVIPYLDQLQHAQIMNTALYFKYDIHNCVFGKFHFYLHERVFCCWPLSPSVTTSCTSVRLCEHRSLATYTSILTYTSIVGTVLEFWRSMTYTLTALITITWRML